MLADGRVPHTLLDFGGGLGVADRDVSGAGLTGLPASDRHPRSGTGSARGRQTSPRRVRDLIGLAVRLGIHRPGEHLVEHELVEVFDTSRTAVRAALAHLTRAGLIERRPRVGTSVRNRGLLIPMADPIGSDLIEAEVIDERLVPNVSPIRERLEVEDDHVRMLEFRLLHRRKVVGLRTSYQPVASPIHTPVLRDPDSSEEVLADRRSAVRVELSVGAEPLDETDARILKVPAGVPVIVREVTHYAPAGEAVDISFERFLSRAVRLEAAFAVAGGLPEVSLHPNPEHSQSCTGE